MHFKLLLMREYGFDNNKLWFSTEIVYNMRPLIPCSCYHQPYSTLFYILLKKPLSNFNCFVIMNVLIGIRLYVFYFITLYMHALYIKFQYVATNQRSFYFGNKNRNSFELLSWKLAISLLRTLDRNGWTSKLMVNKLLD